MRQTAIAFTSKGLRLEGVVSATQEVGLPHPGAVLCHSHPAFGGSMDDPVIVAVAQSLAQRGIASLRFNFRGVGDSQGVFSNGSEEGRDLAAAVELLKRWPGIQRRRVAVVGYSLGAQVALQHPEACKGVRALVLLSPPLPSLANSPVGKEVRPRLFLIGERDRLVGAGALREALSRFERPAGFEVVPGADHSWRGREEEVAQRVAAFLARVLG